MLLTDYLHDQLTALNPQYEWSIDTSWSGSTYINVSFPNPEDDNNITHAVIRFSDHERPAVISSGGVAYHNYLKEIHVDFDKGILKGYAQAIVLTLDKLVNQSIADVAEDNWTDISWDNRVYEAIKDNLLFNDDFEEVLTFND